MLISHHKVFVELPQLIDLYSDDVKADLLTNIETRTTFLEANISWGCPNQARHCVTIVVL